MRAAVLAAALFCALGVLAVAQGQQKITVTFPPPLVQFKNGPNLGVAQANCLVCHGADYIYTQPPLTRAQWTAEVNKMRAAYKAQIADDDVPKIVDYLLSQNGKP
ncbi:MAG: cytochrome c [Candidatus Eremiobacteraeota bacterium]|nr:cytochrome c [Candidatus Eremiobacteraeota bacterium]